MIEMVVGIIAFNPNINRLRELQRLLQEDGISFCIIDNGSDNAAEIQQELASETDIEIIYNRNNMGVATAVNQLVQRARNLSAAYIMPLDQDALFAHGYAGKMLEKFKQLLASQPRLAALGAKVFDVGRNSYEPFVCFDLPWQKSKLEDLQFPFSSADFLITSGTVMSVKCIEQVGAMREDLFIDSVDLDWSFRARAQGWSLAGCETSVIYQEIGAGVVRVPALGINVRTHQPLRYYYMTRNRVFLYRQPYAKWGWLLRDFPKTLLKLVFLAAVSPARGQILKEHARGMLDSFKL
ncbi:MAG: rhamnosyltransferase [Halieaceae bacterium]|jgi:rhamnosyltransferase